MPILGVVASQISGHLSTPDSGAMFPIAMANVGSAGAAYVEFTSIPATYKHLQLRFFMQEATSGGSFRGSVLQFNGTTSSGNYKNHQISGNGSSASAYTSTNTSSIASGESKGFDTDPYNFGVSIIDILDYANTNKLKTVRALNGYDANGSGVIVFNSGVYLTNNNAISSIKIIPETTFTQYTQVALFGIKG